MSNKKIFLAAVLAVVVIGVGLSWWLVGNKNDSSKQQTQFITQVERNLTQESRKVYEDRLSQAREQLKDLPENAPNEERYNLHYTIGSQYYGLGQLAKAKDAYLEAEKYQSVSPNVYLSLYNVYLEMQDFANAKLTMEKAINNDPLDPEMWRQYFYLQKDKLNATEAGQDALFHMALKSTNNNSEILGMYSEFLENLGDKNKAISYLQEAIKVNPDGKEIYEQEIARIRAR